MSVRRKTLLTISITGLVLLAALVATSRLLLLGSFKRLEAQSAHQDVERVLDAITFDLANLDGTTIDWASWDDSYSFAGGTYLEYVEDNLMNATFDSLRLNLALYLDCAGEPFFGKAYDLTAHQEIPVPPELLPLLSDHPIFTCDAETKSSLTGIAPLDKAAMIVVARSILTSEDSGPARGTLVFGRFLDLSEVERLSRMTHLAVSIIPIKTPHLEPGIGEILSSFPEEGEPIYVRPLDGQTVFGYGLMKGITGTPALIVRVGVPRTIYKQGQSTLSYFIISLLAVCLVFGGLALFQLENLVLLRLTRLNQDVQAIGMSRDRTARLQVKGNDEITKLGFEINHMLESLKSEEDKLRVSEERYALAVGGANDGIWDWDLDTGTIYFSPRWKSMLGYKDGEIGDQPEELFRRVHPEDLTKLKEDINLHLEGRTPHLQSEFRVNHKDGAYRWMLYRGLAVNNNGSRPARLAGSQTDITDSKRTEQQLEHKALHDELTDLPNRALFMDRLGHVIERAKRRSDYLAAVLFMDLDRFKMVNDSLGHATGDLLLIAIARRLLGCLRTSDTISRFGGDEFAILLEDIKQVSDATRIAERFQRELTKSFELNGQRVFTTASIGIAPVSSRYQRTEEVLRDADNAMYRAKARGKARYEIFDSKMHVQVLTQLELEADLRQAIAREQLSLVYQPILSLQSSQIIGVEALLRWQHPGRGLLTPADFLGMAEETGLIVPVGAFVLRKACTQGRAWHKAGFPDLRMAVNISARQFMEKNLPQLVKSTLVETGFPSQCLEIEITEKTAMQDIDLTIRTLVELSGVEVQVSIDDFGSGYSALGYLKRFPVNSLKIDRSFISDVISDPDDAAITSAIIAMAHVLKLNVVAEGVETEMQLEFLKSQQCDHIQGYLISHALPVEEITDLLHKYSGARQKQNLTSLGYLSHSNSQVKLT